MIADCYFAATVGEIGRLGIMTKREYACFRADAHIITCTDRELPTIKQTPEINDIALADKHFSAIEKPATQLDTGSSTQSAEPVIQKAMPDPTTGDSSKPSVVAEGNDRTAKPSQKIHGLLNKWSIRAAIFVHE